MSIFHFDPIFLQSNHFSNFSLPRHEVWRWRGRFGLWLAKAVRGSVRFLRHLPHQHLLRGGIHRRRHFSKVCQYKLYVTYVTPEMCTVGFDAGGIVSKIKRCGGRNNFMMLKKCLIIFVLFLCFVYFFGNFEINIFLPFLNIYGLTPSVSWGVSSKFMNTYKWLHMIWYPHLPPPCSSLCNTITGSAGFNEFGFNELSRFSESVFDLKYFLLHENFGFSEFSGLMNGLVLSDS